MRLTSIQTNDSGNQVETLIEESDSLEYLKAIGLATVVDSNEESPEWVDCTPPTMGNDKLKDTKIRLTLGVSKCHYLVLEA